MYSGLECDSECRIVVVLHIDESLFFFFQAEDGIRDLTVTGVQTCALPICAGCGRWRGRRLTCAGGRGRTTRYRSGERRGGEEWRSRWAPYHLKKKKLICNTCWLIEENELLRATIESLLSP